MKTIFAIYLFTTLFCAMFDFSKAVDIAELKLKRSKLQEEQLQFYSKLNMQDPYPLFDNQKNDIKALIQHFSDAFTLHIEVQEFKYSQDCLHENFRQKMSTLEASVKEILWKVFTLTYRTFFNKCSVTKEKYESTKNGANRSADVNWNEIRQAEANGSILMLVYCKLMRNSSMKSFLESVPSKWFAKANLPPFEYVQKLRELDDCRFQLNYLAINAYFQDTYIQKKKHEHQSLFGMERTMKRCKDGEKMVNLVVQIHITIRNEETVDWNNMKAIFSKKIQAEKSDDSKLAELFEKLEITPDPVTSLWLKNVENLFEAFKSHAEKITSDRLKAFEAIFQSYYDISDFGYWQGCRSAINEQLVYMFEENSHLLGILRGQFIQMLNGAFKTTKDHGLKSYAMVYKRSTEVLDELTTYLARWTSQLDKATRLELISEGFYGVDKRSPGQMQSAHEIDEKMKRPKKILQKALSDFKGLNKVSNQNECTICLEDIFSQTPKKLTCAHMFHENCIMPWLSLNPTCPYCKQRQN